MQRMWYLLSKAGVFALMFVLLTSSAVLADNIIRIGCPTEVPTPDGDSVLIPVYITNESNLGGFTLPFKWNSPDVEILSYDLTGSCLPAGGFFQFTGFPGGQQVLPGWITFNPTAPLTPQNDALLFSMWAVISADADPQCVDIYNEFIPPAGTWVFSPMSGGSITPDFSDCGIGDIIIAGASCEENHPPTAICIDVTVEADDNCEASASVDGGSYDEDGDPITLEQEPPGPYGLGDTDVILIVTDDEGLADTCDAIVTVVDITPPIVSCPSDMVVENDIEDCGAIVEYSADYSDNCGGGMLTSNPPSGSFFPVGVTTVEVIATDDAGNADTCYFNVTVNDVEPPTAYCNEPLETGNDPGECGAAVYYDDYADAYDNCGVESLDFDPPSGSYFEVGSHSVMVVATDAAGNADTCYFDVIVNDYENPIAICPADTTVVVDIKVIVEFDSDVDDNCPGATIACDPPSGSEFGLGTTMVTCVATDASGNVGTCTFNITVELPENDPPVARDTVFYTQVDIPVGIVLPAYDPNGDPLDYQILDGPFNGIISGFDPLAGTGTYTPNAGYVGIDSLLFDAYDGEYYSNVGIVYIIISGAGKAILIPEEQYVYYAFAINPKIDSIIFGNLPDGHVVGDIIPASVRVNGMIDPNTNILPSYPDFTGAVMTLDFLLPDFLDGYPSGLLDTTFHQFTVTGEFIGGELFSIIGDFAIIGKKSTNPQQFILPPGEIVLYGDCDRNGYVEITDAAFLIRHIFQGAEFPKPVILGDADCSNAIEISDVVYIIDFIFSGGPYPGAACMD